MTEQTDIQILRNAMLFTLTRRQWSNRRHVESNAISADCDKSKLSTTKKLIVSDKLDRVSQHLNTVYNWCLARSMMSETKRGYYFVRRDMVNEFESYLDEARTMLQALVEELKADMPRAKEAAKLPANEGGLGALYNEDDYPADNVLEQLFGIEHSWLELSVPNELPEEVRARECAKLRESFEDAQHEMVFVLHEQFKGIIHNAVSLLTGTSATGKPRIFGAKTVESLEKFFDTFRAKNLMDDAELERLAQQAKAIVAGIDTDRIKDDTALRQQVAQQFVAVTDSLSKMVVEKPTRRFKLAEAA